MQQGIVLEYVKSCTSGALSGADCGPIWQMAVIGALLLAAVVTLLVLRIRARSVPQQI
jgi:hypothetical protein